MAETAQNLQKRLDIVFCWCEKWRLSLNEKKTQIMHVRKANVPQSNFNFNFGTNYGTQEFPTPNLDRYMAERHKIFLPSLSDVIHMTPQKIFPDRETAIEYFLLIPRDYARTYRGEGVSKFVVHDK